MKISIIIPTFNEEKTVGAVINKVLSVKLPGYEKEIIVVDDGSTDKTKKALAKFRKNKKVKLMYNSLNLGKGASLSRAFKAAKGEILVVQDADLEYDPQDLIGLIKPFNSKNVKVVYGSRKLRANPISHWTFNFGGKLVTAITNLLYGTSITDESTGYKLFRKGVIDEIKIKSKGFEFCPEITAKIAKRGIKIKELPISYNPRKLSQKKIKWWDGFVAIYYLFKYRFVE